MVSSVGNTQILYISNNALTVISANNYLGKVNGFLTSEDATSATLSEAANSNIRARDPQHDPTRSKLNRQKRARP
jgi:hypothetical protein